MDAQKLNKALLSLIKRRNELRKMGYDHPDYDQAEEDLQDAEQTFLDIYGDYLDEALTYIHETYCPESDALLPTAYIPRQYKAYHDPDLDIETFEVGDTDGVTIDLTDFPNLEARLLLLPSQPRFVIVSAAGEQEVWWAK